MVIILGVLGRIYRKNLYDFISCLILDVLLIVLFIILEFRFKVLLFLIEII